MGQIEADKIRILYVHHAAGWGGAVINLINIINALDKSQYSVHVLLIKDSVVRQKLELNGIPYSIVKSNFLKKYYRYYTNTIPGRVSIFNIRRQISMVVSWFFVRYFIAKKELSGHQFDIIHFNSSVLTDWLAPAKKLRYKTVIHVQEPVSRGTWGIRYNFFRRQMITYADKIIAISEDIAKRVNIPNKTVIVYNFYEFVESMPPEESYTSKKILYVGGDAEIKGFYTLVKALAYIQDGILVVFAGSYRYTRGYIKGLLPKNKRKNRAIAKLLKSKTVELVGEFYDIKPYLDRTCCLVSPFSINHFSRPIIEAYANFKPVVATKIPGIDEQIISGKSGVLIERNNPQQLAKTINDLCNKPQLLKEMGILGNKMFLSTYSKNNVDKINLLYRSLQ